MAGRRAASSDSMKHPQRKKVDGGDSSLDFLTTTTWVALATSEAIPKRKIIETARVVMAISNLKS